MGGGGGLNKIPPTANAALGEPVTLDELLQVVKNGEREYTARTGWHLPRIFQDKLGVVKTGYACHHESNVHLRDHK